MEKDEKSNTKKSEEKGIRNFIDDLRDGLEEYGNELKELKVEYHKELEEAEDNKRKGKVKEKYGKKIQEFKKNQIIFFKEALEIANEYIHEDSFNEFNLKEKKDFLSMVNTYSNSLNKMIRDEKNTKSRPALNDNEIKEVQATLSKVQNLFKKELNNVNEAIKKESQVSDIQNKVEEPVQESESTPEPEKVSSIPENIEDIDKRLHHLESTLANSLYDQVGDINNSSEITLKFNEDLQKEIAELKSKKNELETKGRHHEIIIPTDDNDNEKEEIDEIYDDIENDEQEKEKNWLDKTKEFAKNIVNKVRKNFKKIAAAALATISLIGGAALTLPSGEDSVNNDNGQPRIEEALKENTTKTTTTQDITTQTPTREATTETTTQVETTQATTKEATTETTTQAKTTQAITREATTETTTQVETTQATTIEDTTKDSDEKINVNDVVQESEVSGKEVDLVVFKDMLKTGYDMSTNPIAYSNYINSEEYQLRLQVLNNVSDAQTLGRLNNYLNDGVYSDKFNSEEEYLAALAQELGFTVKENTVVLSTAKQETKAITKESTTETTTIEATTIDNKEENNNNVDIDYKKAAEGLKDYNADGLVGYDFAPGTVSPATEYYNNIVKNLSEEDRNKFNEELGRVAVEKETNNENTKDDDDWER